MGVEDDKWAAAYSRLQSATEVAREAGMTDEEIEQCIEETRLPDKPHVGGGPKRPREALS